MSGNPVFNERRFTTIANSVPSNEVMTVEGALQKASILFGALLVGMLVMFGAYAGLDASTPGAGVALAGVAATIGGIGAFILVIGLVFVRPKGTPTFAMTAYVGLEILFLSGFTYIMELAYPGIALQAGLVTAGITGSMTMLYTSRVIRVGPRFNMVMAALVSTVMFVYVGQFLLYLIGGVTIPFIHGSGLIGIGFSAIIVAIASFTLLSDFYFIETGAAHGFPKHMEWWAAFGLLMSVVWIYIEVLRLISKLRD
ncbi:MAG: Bax inhibitor-1/YccA family protein [Candidatus Poseidoniaceae archaeon]